MNAIFVFFVLQWTLRQLLDSTARIGAGITAFILGTTVSAFVAFLQTEFHVLGYSHQASLEGSRAVGLSDQPDIAAVAFALALVFAVGLVVELGLRRRWYLGVCIALLAGALIFSASVSGMACAVLGCFVLFVARGFRLRTVLGVVAALAVVYTVAVSVQSNGSHFDLNPIARIEQTTGNNTGYNTVNPRVATIEHSWSGIVQSPIIGHGLDQTTIAVYYDPDVGTYYPAHDFLIFYWFAGGIFMVPGAALMMGSSFNRLLSGRRRAAQGSRPGYTRHRPRRLRRRPALLTAVARARGPLALAALLAGAVLPRPRRDAAGWPRPPRPGARAAAVSPRAGVAPAAVRRASPLPAHAAASTGMVTTLGLGEMFDDRILGLDSAHVFMVSAQAVAGRSRIVAEVGCGRGALVDTDRRAGPGRTCAARAAPSSASTSSRRGGTTPSSTSSASSPGTGAGRSTTSSVDLAVSDFVLEHVTDPEDFVRELAGVLRPVASSSPGPSAVTPSWLPRPASCRTTFTPEPSSTCSRAARNATFSAPPTR